MDETAVQRRRLQQFVAGGEIIVADVSIERITFTRRDSEACKVEPSGSFAERSSRLEAAVLIAWVFGMNSKCATQLKELMDRPFSRLYVERAKGSVMLNITIHHLLG